MEALLRLFGFSTVRTNDNKIDEATGLTERQKKLVRCTWTIIKKNQVASGTAIMLAFFKKYPHYQRFFAPFKDVPLEELHGNKRFQAHCASIIAALNNVVESLHDVELLEANLISIGERHKKRGQSKVEFQHLKEVILQIFPQAIGKQYTMEVSEAWSKTLDIAFGKIFEMLIG